MKNSYTRRCKWLRPMSEQQVPLMDVKEVRTGISTTVFKKKTNGRKHMVHTYVSLVMPYGTVDIQCASEEQRDFMLIGIMSFIAQERSK